MLSGLTPIYPHKQGRKKPFTTTITLTWACVEAVVYPLTPWKFNIAPEKWWLEDYFPIGKATFQGLC